jgi:hypothetical protein
MYDLTGNALDLGRVSWCSSSLIVTSVIAGQLLTWSTAGSLPPPAR